MSFATAASAAVADGFGAIGKIAEPGGSAGGELPGLEDDAGIGEVQELILGTTLLQSKLKNLFELVL